MQDPDGSSSAVHDENAEEASTVGSPIISMIGSEKKAYAFTHRHIEHLRQRTGVRVAPLRGVGATPSAFATEQFIDEIAAEQAIDPVEYRLRLLSGSPRGVSVIERAAKMADWHSSTPGRAKGIAFSDYQNTFAALVAEVSLATSGGPLRVHNLWIAFDPRLVVQPDNTRSQLEGGLIFGLSHALLESVTLQDGLVRQSNFHNYPVLRMRDVPEIHIDLIPSGGHPTGVGEMGALLPAAAVANAFHALTGKRLRHMPMTPARIAGVLNG